MEQEQKADLNFDLQQILNLEGVLQILKKNIFVNLNVCLPATVIDYNTNNNTVSVQPSIQKILTNNKIVDRVLLSNIPVLEIGGKSLSIKIPLQKGDTGLILVCDRDITLFKQEKKKTQPQTLRKHDLSDSIFIPMFFCNSGSSENIEIQNKNGSSKLSIKNNGIDIVGNLSVDGNISATGDIVSTGKMEAGNGATGTFTDTGTGATGKTITITKGIITQITG